MTSGEPDEAQATPWTYIGRIAARLKGEAISAGDRARLRRMDPKEPGRAGLALYRLFADVGLDPNGDEAATRWALVAHCLALARGEHQPKLAAGRVLHGLPLTEGRFNQLLAADTDVLFDLLPRLARRLDSKAAAIDWVPLALLALYGDTKMGDQQRQIMARDYAFASRTSTETAA